MYYNTVLEFLISLVSEFILDFYFGVLTRVWMKELKDQIKKLEYKSAIAVNKAL